jgi:hypothetical protein
VASSTIEQRLTRQRRSRRTWIIYAIPAVLLVLRGVFDFAFDRATGRVVHLVSGPVHGDPRLMAVAGLLTVAYAPLAVAVAGEDRRAWYGRPASPTSPADTGVIHMTTRARAGSGHKIARRPILHWLRRIPLAAAVLVAILFWPLTGAAMSGRWLIYPGGHAFADGWRIGLAAAALGALVVLAEPWITAAGARRRWLPRTTIRLITNLLPLLAIAAALLFV